MYVSDGSVIEPWSYSALNDVGGGASAFLSHHLTHTHALRM
jgi:hypothetical protein